MRDTIKLPLTLFLVTLTAGLILGAASYLTKEPIAQQHELALKKAREELFKDSKFSELEDYILPEEHSNIITIYEADKNGKLAGHIITMTKVGYAGEITINVGVSIDGVIKGVIVGINSETPGLGAKASEVEFSGQFAGKKNIKLVKGAISSDDEISAITAATITSQALVDGANQAIIVSDLIMGGLNE